MRQLPNGYLVSYCDGLTKVDSVKREFKPNPEVHIPEEFIHEYMILKLLLHFCRFKQKGDKSF